MRTLITKHPLATFYALTFAISWGALLLLVGGPSGLPRTPEEVARLMPRAIITLLSGPLIAGSRVLRAALPAAPLEGGRALVRRGRKERGVMHLGLSSGAAP